MICYAAVPIIYAKGDFKLIVCQCVLLFHRPMSKLKWSISEVSLHLEVSTNPCSQSSVIKLNSLLARAPDLGVSSIATILIFLWSLTYKKLGDKPEDSILPQCRRIST